MIFGGRGVSLSGSGSTANPLVLDVSTVAYFQREPGEGTEVAVTGTGTPGDPYVIEADLTYTGSVPVHSTYSTPGSVSTWVKPAGVNIILVTLIGGGQGGQGGGGYDAVLGSAGGLGGCGGGLTQRYVWLPATAVSITVTVGAGGSGGSGAAIPYGLPQVAGNFGGDTKMTLNTATSTIQTYYAGGGGSSTSVRGYGTQNGQQPPSAYPVPVPITVNNAGSAGGGGEGEGVNGGPRMGGAHNLYAGLILDPTKRPRGGNGGSGGGVIGGSGRNGDNGYLYGGGGGGGGGATVANPYAGHGGNGAAGIAMITIL